MAIRYLAALLAGVALAGAQTRDPLPVPDVGGYRALKCDFHQHTVFSDGLVWPTVRIQEAWRDGLDAIAITDHADYRPHDEDLKASARRPYELARQAAEELGLILIPGIEVSEGDTHCNALFVTDPDALRGLKLEAAARAAHAQGAFLFWNHPGWKGTPEWIPLIAGLDEQKLLAGMELVNGDTFYPEAYPWVEQKRLTIFANSDVHGVSAGGRRRPVTLVFSRAADAEGVREALAARRTVAWMNGQLWGSEELLRGLWQGAIRVERRPDRRLYLHNRSAIPFRVALRNAPPWLRMRGGEVPPEQAASFAISIAKTAPVEAKAAPELELEITNLHTGPDRNLAVRLPVE